MRPRRALWFLGFFGAFNVALAAATAACGSRTGLLVGDVAQSSVDASDARRDALTDRDAPPGLDVTPRPDANRTDCQDAGDTLIYVVQNDTELYAFDPTALSFRFIGTLACPDPNSLKPFSMAVDRKGIAYVLYATQGTNGNLFRVSTATAACAPTKFLPGQLGFGSFGMGFAADDKGPGETLYIASDDDTGGRLGSIDVNTFVVRNIGPFDPPLTAGELTGTGDGRLYTFFSAASTGGSTIAEVEKGSGKIVGSVDLPTVDRGSAWAFAFWGGDFYLFTSQSWPSDVTRYRPSDGSVTVVATAPGGQITGAGVSTCAPSQ